ncbi:hypothetical protein SDC9_116681 [bioreactor metagenome]|uniref:Uncharacterized protein n=1 Tax=bioreactor metagenome TaxID=1076179 RepID=A0A645C317_9ZZZZ
MNAQERLQLDDFIGLSTHQAERRDEVNGVSANGQLQCLKKTDGLCFGAAIANNSVERNGIDEINYCPDTYNGGKPPIGEFYVIPDDG